MSVETQKRAEWLDVARGILVTLVVFGHLIETNLSGSLEIQAIYLLIYAFHIPAFSFASGYVSSTDLTKQSLYKILTSLIQPLIICQIMFWLIEVHIFGKNMDWVQAFFVPYWVLWYLFSLALWRIMLAAFGHWPKAVIISVITGLAVGLVDNLGYGLSISRTFVFFPFFVAGHLLAKNADIQFPPNLQLRPVAIGVFITAGFAAYFLAINEFDPRSLYHALSYEALNLDWHMGIALRLATLVVAGVLIYFFFALIPCKSSIFAHIGRHSLFPYLSHGIIIKLAVGFGLFELLQQYLPVEVMIIGSIFIALALCFIFTRPTVLALQKAIYLPFNSFIRL